MEEKAKSVEIRQPVTERIRTMEDVFKELGTDHPLVREYHNWLETTDPELRSDYTGTFLQLRMVCEALNEGCFPPEQCNIVYWPWIILYRNKKDIPEYYIRNDRFFEIPESVRCVLFGGFANYGSYAGFACARSNYAPSLSSASVGSRLCLKSRELAIHAAIHFAELWTKFYFM